MPSPPPTSPTSPAPPADGRLPEGALARAGRGQGWGLYVHVPFCRVRCGYCDFNTYVPAELGAGGAAPSGASPESYVDVLQREIRLAATVLGDHAGPVSTVFVGGGTPTLLPAADLVRILRAADDTWGLAPGAEVTVEANPDTVSPGSLAALADGGFTRVSLGMQSAVPHVLAALDRTHDPAGVRAALEAARRAGLATSLDLIYGAPGETLADWRESLTAVVELGPDHVSAYALVVEEGTRLAARIRRGELAPPEDDDEADKYELAEEILTAAGYGWYEISNWARSPAQACRHNLGYWHGLPWWGLGPGAHSHVGGVRWWNVRHPIAYAQALLRGESPAQGREVLTDDQRYDEEVLLRVRLAEGLPLAVLRREGLAAVPALVADSLVQATPAGAGAEARVVLTLRGRLLADTVVRRLLGV